MTIAARLSDGKSLSGHENAAQKQKGTRFFVCLSGFNRFSTPSIQIPAGKFPAAAKAAARAAFAYQSPNSF
jgi:hypothetical protein